MAQLPSHRSSPQQWRAAALLPQLALLLASATAAVELTWHGPTADIWTDSQCALLGSACKGTGHTVRDCEAACSKTKGCTAVAFNTGSGTGDRCQLRGCNTSHPAPVPRWSVPQWRGFATFPVPVAPPTPPAPPAPPQVPLILLEKQLKETGARCLDGTPQGMYFEPGVGEDAKNWVVALDGGGWCYNLAPSEQDPFSEPGPGGTEWGNADSCWGRSHSSLGSTLPQYHPRSIAGGYLAGTPMANWSRAQVLYCDGGSFSGNRDEPVTVSGTGTPGAEVNRTLYFRGQRNLDAVIDELRSRGMGTAAGGGEGGMAVLSGCSAGGLGALVQCDHFASQLPAGMKPRCIGDAGVFMDATSLTTFDGGKSLMQMQFGNVVTMQNASLSPHCLASKQNTFPAACFFPQNTLPTQQTPTFVRNSFYNYGDWEVLPANWHNSHNFTDAGPSPMSGWKNPYSKDPGTCTWETGRKTNSTAEDGCDAKQHGVMRRFQQEFSAAMAPVLEPSSPHGCFVDNCAVCHCSHIFNSMVIGNVTEREAFSDWLLHDKAAKIIAKPIV